MAETITPIPFVKSETNAKIYYDLCRDDQEFSAAANTELFGWSGNQSYIWQSNTPEPSSPPKADKESMSESVGRYELDAKLEAVEARMDARIARIESSVASFQQEALQIRSDMKNAKWWAIGTAVAVLSIFVVVLTWGLSAQKEENARFNNYVREDVKSIKNATEEMAKTLLMMQAQLKSSSKESSN